MGRVSGVREVAAPTYESLEEINGLDQAGTTITSLRHSIRGDLFWRSGDQVWGVSGAPVRTLDAGMLWISFVSGAAVQNRVTSFLNVPLNFLPSSIPTFARRRFRLYRHELTVKASALAATGAHMSITPATSLTTATQIGAEWFASTGLNAGAWTPRYRKVSLGALTIGPSSGVVAGASPHVLGIDFIEGPVPTVRWLMDGTQVFSIEDATGIVTMAGSGGQNMRLMHGTDAGAVGTTLLATNARLIIREV